MKIVKNNQLSQNLDNQSFEVKILKFLGKNGFIVPENEQEIKSIIDRCENMEMELPQALMDPLAILERGIVNSCREVDHNNEDFKAIEDNLAQAAREGTEIPSHIQKKMEEKRKRIDNN